MPEVYPNISTDRYNIPYASRFILASDVFRPKAKIDTGRNIRETEGGTGAIINVGDIYGSSGRMPDDEELQVGIAGGETVNNIPEGAVSITLTKFTGWQINPFRNNIPMVNLQEDENGFRWDIKTGKFTPFVLPVIEEIFTFQAKWELPNDLPLTAVVGGGNINNAEVDNGIIFLTTFVNTRLRVFRNNILQSFKTDFGWDNEFAKLTLTINPFLDEEFRFQAY